MAKKKNKGSAWSRAARFAGGGGAPAVDPAVQAYLDSLADPSDDADYGGGDDGGYYEDGGGQEELPENWLYGEDGEPFWLDPSVDWDFVNSLPPLPDEGWAYDENWQPFAVPNLDWDQVLYEKQINDLAAKIKGDQPLIPPPKKLAESPEWLAYLNALDLEEKQFRSDIDRQRAFNQSSSVLAKSDLEQPYSMQRRNISQGMEARGMSRSGENLRRLAESRADQGRAQSNIDTQLAQSSSTLESQLAQRLMDLNARKSERELEMKRGGYV